MTGVRAARTGDLAAVLALWEVAAENDARPADDLALVEQLVAHDPEALLVAVRDERVVGTVIAGWDGWRAHLYRLAVHPDVRRTGVGGLLLDAAGERLVALGAGRLDAMVLEGNALGSAVWRARGYAPQGEWRRWVRSI